MLIKFYREIKNKRKVDLIDNYKP